VPIPYQPDPPDEQSIELSISEADVVFDRWTSYEFNSDFLTPTDSFHFTLGVGEGLPDGQRNALRVGAQCRLYLGTNILADGRIDGIEISADRHGGITYNVRGRDWLGQTLDTVADPRFQLKNGGTLAELLKRLFAPFGYVNDDDFALDNDANREAKSGVRGFHNRPKQPVSTGSTKARRRKSKPKAKPLSDYELHQTKPYNHESVFHFASRVTQRQGLWIWASADGETLIVGKPDFDQEPLFSLYRLADGYSNVLSGTVHYDLTNQPTIIVADAFAPGGAGEFGKGRCKGYILHPILGYTATGNPKPEALKLIESYPGAVESILPAASFREAASFSFRPEENFPFRPMFLHDDESKTPEQLDSFLKREMSLLYRQTLTARYTVEGHGQTVDGSFIAWTPDTVVDVVDEIAGVRELLYVLGVRFAKSRTGGTTTELELIRLHSIFF